MLAKKASDEASVSQAGARVAGNDANPASGSEEIPLVRVRTWLSGSFSRGSKMVLEMAPPMEDVSAQAGLECQAAETQIESGASSRAKLRDVSIKIIGLQQRGVLMQADSHPLMEACGYECFNDTTPDVSDDEVDEEGLEDSAA